MSTHRLRCAAVGLALTVGAVGAGAWLGQAASASSSPAGADDALVRCCLLALVGCTGWAWLTGLAAVADAWRSGGTGPVVADRPRGVVRRVVLAACGVAVSSVLLAAPGHAADHTPGGPGGPGGLDGLPLPDRAEGTSETVAVRAGDTLWDLAAARLPGAGDTDVAAATRRLYAANRATVGPDPDLIRPGQVLHLPGPAPDHTRQTGDPR